MRNPPDPYEPASELYRLSPPRRRSELREALDAATGHDRQDTGGTPILSEVPAGKKGSWKWKPFAGDVASNALGALFAAAALAAIAFLWTHVHHASQPPARLPRPSATVPTRTAAKAAK